jgi:Ser/Thr protein kinase RdoA (MazF antagonist)
VGLAVSAAGLAVGSVDLGHGEPGRAEIAGQGRAVAAGAFQADPVDDAMRSEPRRERTVAGGCGGELSVAEVAAEIVDRGGVVSVAVGVDPTDHDGRGRGCHAGHALLPPLDRSGEARSGRVGGQDSVPGAQAPMRSRHPAVRVLRLMPAGSTDRSKDSFCVSRAAGQIQRATPESSSLSCVSTLSDRCTGHRERRNTNTRGTSFDETAVARIRCLGQGGRMPSLRSQVARLRQVALAALARYPLPDGRLRFLMHGENTTFRHDSAAGQYLVRVHRPHRHGRNVSSAAAIGSELAWLRALRKDTDLAVPDPLAALDGAPAVEASAAGETRTCSILRWMDGRIREASAHPIHLRRLGDAMARLHNQADTWTPPPNFVRIRWDHEAFFGDVMVYGDTPARGCWALLPADVRARFEAVEARMAAVMVDVGGVGLIHADLHLGNALFHRGDVRLIDFDDCGTGARLYELAVALWELRDRPDYAMFREALLSGYRASRDIDVTHLDDFIALRQVAFDLWYTGMAQVNPAFAGKLDGVHRWSLSMLDLVEAR